MRWEYLIIVPHKDLEKREFAFNYLGDDGWELVAVYNEVVYFKRPKQQKFSYTTVENGYIVYGPDGKKVEPWGLVEVLNE